MSEYVSPDWRWSSDVRAKSTFQHLYAKQLSTVRKGEAMGCNVVIPFDDIKGEFNSLIDWAELTDSVSKIGSKTVNSKSGGYCPWVKDVRNIFSKEAVELVQWHYANDFALFGWSPELTKASERLPATSATTNTTRTATATTIASTKSRTTPTQQMTVGQLQAKAENSSTKHPFSAALPTLAATEISRVVGPAKPTERLVNSVTQHTSHAHRYSHELSSINNGLDSSGKTRLLLVICTLGVFLLALVFKFVGD
jgi:hypothetical protein